MLAKGDEVAAAGKAGRIRRHLPFTYVSSNEN